MRTFSGGWKCCYHFHRFITETWRPCRSQESCFHMCRVRSHISLGKSVPGEITSRCNHHSQVTCKSYVLVHIWNDPWISELLIFKHEFSQEICELCRAAGRIAGSSCVLPTQLFFFRASTAGIYLAKEGLSTALPQLLSLNAPCSWVPDVLHLVFTLCYEIRDKHKRREELGTWTPSEDLLHAELVLSYHFIWENSSFCSVLAQYQQLVL